MLWNVIFQTLLNIFRVFSNHKNHFESNLKYYGALPDFFDFFKLFKSTKFLTFCQRLDLFQRPLKIGLLRESLIYLTQFMCRQQLKIRKWLCCLQPNWLFLFVFLPICLLCLIFYFISPGSSFICGSVSQVAYTTIPLF